MASPSGEIQVNYSHLDGVQGDLARGVATIDGQLGDLKAYIAPMVATWTGTSSEAYQAKQRQWDEATQDLNALLAAIGKAVGESNEHYQMQESRTTASFE